MLKIITVGSLGLISMTLHAAQMHGMSDVKRIPGQYIVVVDSSAISSSGVSTLANHLNRAFGAKKMHQYQHGLKGLAVKLNDRGLSALNRSRLIQYVEADKKMELSELQDNATWGLDRIDQRDLPLDGDYRYPGLASQVHAYIVDTGIRSSHNDFAGRVASGFTAINDGNGSEDCNGHGTHVAGTVGSSTYGVAKGVSLHPVRVLGCDGSGSLSGVVAGIDWVSANHIKPAVLNMSLGGGVSQALNDAVDRSVAQGVVNVVAAGNESTDACSRSPASAQAALTVAATDRSDRRAGFSNFGRCVDVFAPGVSITSAWHTGDTAINTISGTSMASPHVAGVVALYLEDHPNASPAAVADALSQTASIGRVRDPGQDSTNRLVYIIQDNESPVEPEPEPIPEPPACDGDRYQNNLSGPRAARYEPNGKYYYAASVGEHKGVLTAAANTDFDLYLWKYSFVYRGWLTVGSSYSFTSDESVSYFGGPGYYVWRIESFSGGGDYDFCMKSP